MVNGMESGEEKSFFERFTPMNLVKTGEMAEALRGPLMQSSDQVKKLLGVDVMDQETVEKKPDTQKFVSRRPNNIPPKRISPNLRRTY